MFSGFLVEFGPPNLRVSVSFLSSHIERLPQAGCVQQCACKCLTTGSLKEKKKVLVLYSLVSLLYCQPKPMWLPM